MITVDTQNIMYLRLWNSLNYPIFVYDMKKLLFLLFILPQLVQAQNFTEPDYPQDYFTSPVHIPILLAGNYGELRPAHFHEGMDIKTRGVIGYRVYAAANGYISRIKVHNTGFGHAIYITHPNGYTTVYGHLHSFAPEVAAYVKKQQYKQESWSIDLHPDSSMFPVKQGQKIALSGATGSVAGPHVHFEIRDTKTEHPLNEQLFGFDVKDNIAPSVYRIALYDRNRSIYEQPPLKLLLHDKGTYYSPNKNLITVHANQLGIGVQTIDHQNNTNNTYGVYRAILYVDGVAQNGFQLDNIGYQKTSYVDAHYDYKSYMESGRHFSLLFELPGNKLPIYYDFNGNGTIDLSDGKVHNIKVIVTDASGNSSTIKLKVKQEGNSYPREECSQRMKPEQRNIFYNDKVQFFLKPGSIYDDICFQYKDIPTSYSKYYSYIVRLHYDYVPLQKEFPLRLKPDKVIPENLKDNLVFVCNDASGDRLDVTPAKLVKGWVQAMVGSFGDYSIQVDTKAPNISAINIKDGANLSAAKNIKFRISDSKSGIASYRAELDGKWLRFARDGSTIFYNFDEHCTTGNHTLKLTVTDAVGNKTIKTYHFKR